MLLFLDHSLLASLDANPSPFAPVVIAIELAAEAARQGTHILCGEIGTFDSLLHREAVFSVRTRMLLDRARTKSAFRQDLVDALLWFVRITEIVAQPTIQTNARGQTEILIPPNIISTKGSLLNRPKFIPENDNDGYFYEALTYRVIDVNPQIKTHFSGVTLKFDLTQGGGQTTSTVYANAKAAQDNFCLAVVDSDQSFPKGPLGGTAKAVIAVDAPPNKPEWNARLLVLPVRAVENTFPKEALLRAAKQLDDFLGQCAQDVVAAHANQPHWIYLPLKKGVKCFDVKDKGTAEQQYLGNAIAFTTCPNVSHTPCESREKCPTYIVQSLGTNLLAQVCSQKPIQLNFDPDVDSQLLPLLKELCVEMVAAFCGDEPVLGA